MQRTINKSTKLKTNKSEQLRERLKPMSLEEPMAESPFIQMLDARPVEKQGQGNEDNRDQSFENLSERELGQAKDLRLAELREKEDFQIRQPGQGSETTPVNKVPRRTADNTFITPRKLCKILEIDELDEIFNLSDVLKASSLKLYAALVNLADKNGKLKIKAHELMKESGIKGIATFYKQERWLTDLGLIEKRAKPGPHEGSSYRVFSLNSLPLPDEVVEEFESYAQNL